MMQYPGKNRETSNTGQRNKTDTPLPPDVIPSRHHRSPDTVYESNVLDQINQRYPVAIDVYPY